MPHGERIAEFLLDIGAVKLSVGQPFTWTSGLKAPIYCDNRMIYSHPQARTFVKEALVSRVQSLHIPPDVVAGTAMAAIGWAALVADEMELPFVYVRPKAKEHGAGKRIEGDLKPGRDIVVVEDLISTGGSSLGTVEALREEGKGTVADIVSIFTYEFTEALESAEIAGVRFHPLCSIATLLDVAFEQGRVSKTDVKNIGAFVRDHEHWMP